MADNGDGWWSFIKLLQQAKTTAELDKLLLLLLTAEERLALAKRCQIIEALLKGDKPQRAIAQELQVSISKITRGSNELKQTSEELKHFLQQQLLADK